MKGWLLPGFIFNCLCLLLTPPTLAEPHGRDIFQDNCTPCHTVDKNAVPDMYGFNLTLYGIIGRKSASIEGFQYSEALEKSEITWTSELVDLFITDPFVVLPETKMIFFGLEDSIERKTLVEFLSTLNE